MTRSARSGARDPCTACHPWSLHTDGGRRTDGGGVERSAAILAARLVDHRTEWEDHRALATTAGSSRRGNTAARRIAHGSTAHRGPAGRLETGECGRGAATAGREVTTHALRTGCLGRRRDRFAWAGDRSEALSEFRHVLRVPLLHAAVRAF